MAARPGISEKQNELNNLIQSLSGMNTLLLDTENQKISEVLKTGFVKQFEISVELFWKILKLILSKKSGIELSSPKPVLKVSLQEKLITEDQFEILIKAVELRNMAAHIYLDELVDEIIDFIPQYCKTVENVMYLNESFNEN